MSIPHAIDAETRLCAVIGTPIRHSLSPAIHNAAFQAAEINAVYLAFEVRRLEDFLGGMRATPEFRGLSITIPHKRAVIPLLDSIDPLAESVGSVNTITNTDGNLHGMTTDGLGALRAFEGAGVDLEGKRVLFLGTGGAVRAVAFAIADRCGPTRITILGRTPANVDELGSDLESQTEVPIHTGNLADEIETAMADHDVVINGTPLGMAPEQAERSPVPPETLSDSHVVFDMVYNPRETKLLRDAQAAGCAVVHGIEMLVYQAALQFETWFDQPAPIEAMRGAAMSALAANA